MKHIRSTIVLGLLCTVAVTLLSGCPVWQAPGHGKTYYRRCSAARRNYWLYLPENYNMERRYPMVLTLHGMKPYDSAKPHIEMWSLLADQHGFIVVAPELQTSDSFGQFPLRTMNSAERNDVRCVLAIMDEVMSSYVVDPDAVLLTCWSMGGYLGHYIASEYGDRFAAFAPLQSNFSNRVLNPANARRFAGKLPIFVFYGTGDLAAVTGECKQAIEWWRSVGFNVATHHEPVGHERHPELAAEFFERVLAPEQKAVKIVVTPPSVDPAPLAVNLWPSLSGKIGEVHSYVWNFGALGTSYQKSPNVLIRQAGDYPIRLTVTDAAGRQHSAQTTIRVSMPASARGPASTADRQR